MRHISSTCILAEIQSLHQCHKIITPGRDTCENPMINTLLGKATISTCVPAAL